jgi:flotillin
MGGNGANGGAGQFVQDLYKGVLPLNELAKSVGLNLPAFLGTQAGANPPPSTTGATIAQAVPVVPETKLDVKIDPRRS